MTPVFCTGVEFFVPKRLRKSSIVPVIAAYVTELSR
jgi:hypothetical protein